MPPLFASPRVFRGRIIPAGAELAGYAALAQAYMADAPIRSASCIAGGFVASGRRDIPDWTLFDKRFKPEPSLLGHLTFALRHEPLDMPLLRRIFAKLPVPELSAAISASHGGVWTRRIWFLFEWLTGTELSVLDLHQGNYIDAMDVGLYVTSKPHNSRRHRVRDNLLGVPDFCPVLRRTKELQAQVAKGLGARAQEVTQGIDRRLLARAASFLLLSDSQASFRIEGERPPRNRIERWGRAVMQAGLRPLSVVELERLQSVLIEDGRLVRPGIRTEGVFLGERGMDASPIPEFIGARPESLGRLMAGMIAANDRMTDAGIDPVLQAAATAFGFIMIHPFEDGNGRIHRFLIHHVLAERGFSPPGMLFPVSVAILDELDRYGTILRTHSAPLMDHIDWEPTINGNVHVLNDTDDLYSSFDATSFGEFIYACVERAISTDLPREIHHLQAYDAARTRISLLFDMADMKISLLVNAIRQNGGRLSRNRRKSDFPGLTEDEMAGVERIVREAFGMEDGAGTDGKS